MPGPLGEDDPPAFVGAPRFVGAGFRVMAGSNLAEVTGGGGGGATGATGGTGATGPAGADADLSHGPFTTPTISSNAITINLAMGGIFSVTLTSDVTTVTMSGVTNGEANFFTLRVKQDGTGGRAFTPPASWKFSTGAYSPSSGANKVDLLQGITFDDGTTWMVSYLKDYA